MCGELIKKCHHCRQPIEDDAKVCHNCGRHQHWFFRHLRVEQLGILAAFIMIALVYSELKEARQKRIAADEAKNIALKAADRSQVSEQNIIILKEVFKKQALYITKLIWLQAKIRPDLGTNLEKTVLEKLRDTFNPFLESVIPDETERNKWIQQELEGAILK